LKPFHVCLVAIILFVLLLISKLFINISWLFVFIPLIVVGVLLLLLFLFVLIYMMAYTAQMKSRKKLK